MTDTVTHSVKINQPKSAGELMQAITRNGIPDEARVRFTHTPRDRPFDVDTNSVEFTWETK